MEVSNMLYHMVVNISHSPNNFKSLTYGCFFCMAPLEGKILPN